METVIKNRGTSCVGVRKTGTTLIHVSTVMGTLYYGETLRQIREYEEVFEDKLEDDVKIQLLGYQMNCTETINIKQNDYVNEKDFYHVRCLLVMNFIVVICSHI